MTIVMIMAMLIVLVMLMVVIRTAAVMVTVRRMLRVMVTVFDVGRCCAYHVCTRHILLYFIRKICFQIRGMAHN